MAISKAIGKLELETFKVHFSEYKDQYVLIGGIATKLLLEEANLNARATKDLDIVLCAKALTKDFVVKFWEFVELGGYLVKKKTSGNSVLYRFEQPNRDYFPYMIELLSEKVEYFNSVDQVALPMVIDDQIVSLSAIIMNQEYYDFLMNNRTELDGIILADERVLIPLKINAYRDLSMKKSKGEPVKGDNIKKHRNDVLRLTMLLTNRALDHVPDRIKEDMKLFVDELLNEGGFIYNLGIEIEDIDQIKNILRTVYGLT